MCVCVCVCVCVQSSVQGRWLGSRPGLSEPVSIIRTRPRPRLLRAGRCRTGLGFPLHARSGPRCRGSPFPSHARSGVRSLARGTPSPDPDGGRARLVGDKSWRRCGSLSGSLSPTRCHWRVGDPLPGRGAGSLRGPRRRRAGRCRAAIKQCNTIMRCNNAMQCDAILCNVLRGPAPATSRPLQGRNKTMQ